MPNHRSSGPVADRLHSPMGKTPVPQAPERPAASTTNPNQLELQAYFPALISACVANRKAPAGCRHGTRVREDGSHIAAIVIDPPLISFSYASRLAPSG